MSSFDITLFIVAYVVGFAVSMVIFYKLNTMSHKGTEEEENISLFAAIYLSLLSWICVFFVIIVAIFVVIKDIFEKSKFNEKYKTLNEKFIKKKRD